MEPLPETIVVFGAGGHAKVIIDILEKSRNRPDIYLLDDDVSKRGTFFCGYKVLDSFHSVPVNEYGVIIAIGPNDKRMRKAAEFSHSQPSYITAIHPSAVLAADIAIGFGSAIMPGVVINRDVRVGRHCILNTSSSIDHDCNIADGVHIGPGATLCGAVSVGEGTLVGAGATILPNIEIGKNVVIGGGTTVRKNIPHNTTVILSDHLRVIERE